MVNANVRTRKPPTLPPGNDERGIRGRLIIVLAVLIGCGTLVVVSAAFLFTGDAGTSGEQGSFRPAVTSQEQQELDRQIEEFCSSCHVFPPPSSFPRDAWNDEIRLAFQLTGESNREFAEMPPFEAVLNYFQRRAPPQLQYPLQTPAEPGGAQSCPVRFETEGYGLEGYPPAPGVAHIRYAQLSPPHDRVIVLCDMRHGLVCLYTLNQPDQKMQIIANIPHPAHAEPVDLDQDGLTDLLVSDLGSLFPTNDKVGQVIWLRRRPESESYEPIVLLRDVGRVTDAQAADFDGDGDLDLVVAAFGWRTVGEVLLLENQTVNWEEPHFAPRVLETKTGAIHVPVADLNGDGRPDFVALFSQEHEQIYAYLNDGSAHFDRQPIFASTDPAYGSNGIQLVDLDGDGDLDVLYTNGDSLDSVLVKPYHSVQWLENEGRFPFRYHHLATMAGVSRAVAADLNGDGAVDIVASSFLPNTKFPDRERLRLNSLILLENQGGGRFSRHVLEAVQCDHAVLDIADCNGDGRPDLIVGNFSWDGIDGPFTLAPMPHWFTIWWNRGPTATGAR